MKIIINTWGKETLRQKNEYIWTTEFNLMCYLLDGFTYVIEFKIHNILLPYPLCNLYSMYITPCIYLSLSLSVVPRLFATVKTKWLNHSLYYLFIGTTNICVQIPTSKWKNEIWILVFLHYKSKYLRYSHVHCHLHFARITIMAHIHIRHKLIPYSNVKQKLIYKVRYFGWNLQNTNVSRHWTLTNKHFQHFNFIAIAFLASKYNDVYMHINVCHIYIEHDNSLKLSQFEIGKREQSGKIKLF